MATTLAVGFFPAVAQAAPLGTPPPPQPYWRIRSVGTRHPALGATFRNCVKVSPTPGFTKTYTCSFTGTVGNGYGATVGLSTEGISLAVAYNVTQSWAVTGGVNWTPTQAVSGEIEWDEAYNARTLYEQQYVNGQGWQSATHQGYSLYFTGPNQEFFPAPGIYLVGTAGTFSGKHWACVNGPC